MVDIFCSFYWTQPEDSLFFLPSFPILSPYEPAGLTPSLLRTIAHKCRHLPSSNFQWTNLSTILVHSNKMGWCSGSILDVCGKCGPNLGWDMAVLMEVLMCFSPVPHNSGVVPGLGHNCRKSQLVFTVIRSMLAVLCVKFSHQLTNAW